MSTRHTTRGSRKRSSTVVSEAGQEGSKEKITTLIDGVLVEYEADKDEWLNEE
jgi:hypothetical protein